MRFILNKCRLSASEWAFSFDSLFNSLFESVHKSTYTTSESNKIQTKFKKKE